MKKLSKLAALTLSGAISLTAFTSAHATSYQIFTNIGFTNPASINSIKQGELILGGLIINSRFHFTGTAAGVRGSTTSRTEDFLPYGRIAMRFSPKWVGTFDITQPYFTDIQYPRSSFINVFATETFIRDTNFSPKISYQATERLALGAGLDINNLYNGQLNFAIPPLGDVVIEAKQLSKRFGDNVLFDNVSFSIPKGAVVGIIGPNGAGKSTMFKILNGQDTDFGGDFRIGDAVKLSYVDQSRDALNGQKTVWQEISNEQEIMTIGTFQMPSRAYVGRFNFKGTDQQKNIKDLSGGDRNRVHLAKLLSNGGNVLLLDEPTNDLDVETLRALEEAIQNFPGCAMVVSHDRWFLDRIATHILAFEGDSHVEFFVGNYTEYEDDRIRRLGEQAKQPHRIKYKKLEA